MVNFNIQWNLDTQRRFFGPMVAYLTAKLKENKKNTRTLFQTKIFRLTLGNAPLARDKGKLCHAQI